MMSFTLAIAAIGAFLWAFDRVLENSLGHMINRSSHSRDFPRGSTHGEDVTRAAVGPSVSPCVPVKSAHETSSAGTAVSRGPFFEGEL